ncbi:MAG: hypothetical protein ACYDCN_10785 [Bacteroidia bacterium]
MLVISLLLHAKMGISAMQIARQTGISLKTSWLIAMKLRCAMITDKTHLHGLLQMDESYFGASPDGKKITKDTPANTPILATVTDKRVDCTQARTVRTS